MSTMLLNKVKLMNLSAKERENALNEVRILASIQNNNIISYKEAFIDEDSQSLCIVMEYADDGDLYQKILEHQKANTWFEEIDIWKIFIMVVRGLKTLHDLEIMHRDLKSANVFLFQNGDGKLGDMNVSKVAQKGLNYTQTGTPYYASPEVWRDEAYDVKSDIWSLGWVLYEMVALKPPFRAENMQGLYKKVLKGHYPKISSQFSTDIQTVIKMLLQVSPLKRPTWHEILNHQIIKNIWKTIDNFNDKDDKDNSDADDVKISLLKTIYFPNNSQSILYLSDKLPKPSYNKTLELAVDDTKNSHRETSESPILPDLSKHEIVAKTIKHQSKKLRNITKRSQGSKEMEETKEGVSLVHNGSLKILGTVEELPEVKQLSVKSPSKLSSIERLALRLEQESKIKPEINIDIKEEEIKNSIESKHYVIRNLLQNDIEGGKIKNKSI